MSKKIKVGIIGSQFISHIHAVSLKRCAAAEVCAVASPSGGGVTMDMGCHAIEFFRWILGRPPIKSVYAQMKTYVHQDKTEGDDNSLIIVEFANGVIGLAEESWTKMGGMDDRAEVHGSKG